MSAVPATRTDREPPWFAAVTMANGPRLHCAPPPPFGGAANKHGSRSFPAGTYIVVVPGKGDPPNNKKKGKAAIHPNAPAGGGGPGYFKDVPCLNGPSSGDSSACATPPAKKHVAAKADGATPPKPDPKPPPVTEPGKRLLLKEQTPEQDIEVNIEILDDTRDSKLQRGSAHTSYSFNHTYKSHAVPIGNKISISKFEFKGTITIQTSYGPGAKPDDISRYGRGTTLEDEKNGNVTLGFHESCHRQDYLDYLNQYPLPQFTGEIGMTVQAWKAADARFPADFDKYKAGIKPFSNNRTDEVGYKKSQYDKFGPRKA